MTDREKLKDFAEQLIRQKRMIRSTQNILLISFIVLIAGIALSLPLRYYFGISHIIPILLSAVICLLSFIYGFLGIETHLDTLRETDEKLKLNEKLSAAYQFGSTDNPYSGLLMSDAMEICDSVKANEVYRVRFSRRDPFIPLLLGLFFFLWMSSFSFLQISDEQRAVGELLTDTADRIDAVNSGTDDKDIDELSEEYRKLGQKIQEQFMNDQSIDNEVEELSRKLEEKIEELSREGVDKDSKVLSDEEADSEVYQLERKREMSDELGDILESLMKTFSITPDMQLGSSSSGEGGASGEGESSPATREDRNGEEGSQERESDSAEGSDAVMSDESELEEGDSPDLQENLHEGESNSNEPGQSEGMDKEESDGTRQSPLPQGEDEDAQVAPDNAPGSDSPEDPGELTPFKEEKQSGEFDDDENIRGDVREGEQMKSFIRALPDIVEPTKEEMEVLRFYRNQLETAVDKEILPQGYESVIRDYFLGIGVLRDE